MIFPQPAKFRNSFHFLSKGMGLFSILTLLTFLFLSSAASAQTPVFINEIHYDNTGTDAGEAIEIAGPAGTDLTGWSIVLYNGSGGAVYDTDALSGTIPDHCNGFGVVVLSYPSNGIQNGPPDAIALVNASSAVVQFLSYEGTFTAVGGPANGMVSVDIGVSETGSEPLGQSLRLSGTGQFYEDFTWNSPTTSTFGACNTGQIFVSGDAPPSVTATTPTNNATNIAINTNISITFSEAVDVTGSWFSISGGSSGPHTATVSGGPTTFTLDPDIDFASNESVTITVFAANVTDQDANDPPDNMATDFNFSFTTDLAPSVTTTTPANNATDVATNANITITFSEAVNAAGSWFSISGGTSGSHTATVSGGPTTFTLDPDVDFVNNEAVSITVFAANVTDQDAGDPPDNMAADFNFSFTTSASDVAPTVTSTTPSNGATAVEAAANITITFSESVNVIGNWFSISGGASGLHTATVTGGPTTFTLNPDVDFAFNEMITVNVFAANVTDQDVSDPPDNMAADYIFNFSTPPIIINEILADPHPTNGDANGDGTVNTTQDEFIEFINVSSAPLDISGWTLSDGFSVRHTFPAGTTVTNQCGIVLFAGGTPTGSFGNVVVQIASTGQLGLNNTGDTIELKNGSIVIATYAYGSEGNSDQSLTRDPDIAGPTPLVQHTTATGAAGRLHSPGLKVDGTQFSGCQSTTLTKEIFEIQSNGLASPFDNQNIKTENNVVTAVGSNGFFIQTPAARSDNDAQTSDGIFVFTSSAPTVSVGDLVTVTGDVDEFFNFTELTNNPAVTPISSGNPLPLAVQFDGMTPTPNQPQAATEYERFEGMLVQIVSGVVGGPNQSFGTDPIAEVHVVAGPTRPFRESGIEYPGLAGLPVWDGNPEIFEFDPDRLGQPNLAIPAGSTFSTTGVLGFEFSGYELWPTSYSVNAATLPRAVRARNAGESTIATLNTHLFYDTIDDPNGDDVLTPQEYEDKLNKLSMYVRTLIGAPDILAVQEAEKIEVLQDLANKINSDDASLTYTPYLIEGNDISGIDVGFLVRAGITVNSVTQLGATEIFTFDGSLLHDRPPLLLDAKLADGCDVSVLVVHARSLNDIDDPIDGPRVRQKRHEQAVSISNMVQTQQTANPNINLVVTGDFNAFQFTDGYVHVLGQIMGTPASASEALIPGTDNVNPDLTNAVLSLPANEQYSFVFEGSAQVLDHVLYSQALQASVAGIEYARANSDAAENFEADGTTVLRTSDHDGLVLFIKPNTVVADAGSNQTICAGQSVAIGGSPTASGGTAPYTFSWMPATGLNDATLANPTASPTTTTTYTVEVTDATGCKMTAQVTVTVNALPTATVSGDAAICAGSSTTISAALTGASPWNLTWSDSFTQNGVTTSPATRIVSPATTTTFTITNVADANNCSNSGSGSAVITVNPLPTASISGDDPVDAGTTHTYAATTDASTPSYLWSVTNGTIDGGNNGNSVSVIAGSAGTMVVSVEVTDGATACKNTATKNVTVTSGCALVVDAGADRNVLYALTTTLGGSPTVSGGTPPYTFSWTPTTGLDNPVAANPKATVTSTTIYTVTVTDANNCSGSDQVTVTVLSYVLMSDGYLKISQNKTSKGDIHANDKIEFQAGAPGRHVGNLTATDDITIQTKNLIQGDATAGGDIFVSGTAIITGTTQDHANVAAVPLPSFTFTAGGANINVPANGTRILSPGSYGAVRVNSKGTLILSAGDYYMNVLDAGASSTILSINASAGAVNIYVVNDLKFGSSMQVKITGGTSDRILLVTLQTTTLMVGSKAILYGTLVLPNAPVQFSNNSSIKGAVYAPAITLEALVKFYHHTSPGAFPKESEEVISSHSSLVSDYELAQNYPNPFNPSTRISFALPEAGVVQLAIYNLQGQKVRQLVSGQMNAGRYSLHWDGMDRDGKLMPSGVYLYRLQAGNFVQVRKMTLMK